MSLNIQNVQTKSNYNLSFTAASGNISKAAANIVPAVAATGAAVTAALVLANNLKTGTFYYPYIPEQSHSNKSAEESAKAIILAENSKTGIFYYPYIPERYHSNKSAEESAEVFAQDYRLGKFVRKDVTREGGRITKIVKYFEYPDCTFTTTFDYTDRKSVKITSDWSHSSLKHVKVYKDGLLTESCCIETEEGKWFGKYFDRELYKYDSEGRVAKRLSYTQMGNLWIYEYEYDSKDRIIGITTTITDIPESERSAHWHPAEHNEKIVIREEFQYDKKGNPVRTSRIVEKENQKGKFTTIESHPEEYDEGESFYDPNKHVKLTKNQL